MIIIFGNFISDWIKDILVLSIIISFLEILLPKGKMKKFVNFILGLLIIFVVISPFSYLNQLRLDLDMKVETFMNSRDAQSMLNEQEERIRSTFTNSLSEEIIRLVESNSTFKVVDINISTKEEGNTVLLDEVIIIAKIDDKHRDEIVIDKIKILPANRPVNENDQGHDDLRRMVADYIGIEKNKVYINTM